MSIPSDFDPLAWGERRYIQPVMSTLTTWSNKPSFGMTLTEITTGTRLINAFNGKFFSHPSDGYCAYDPKTRVMSFMMTFAHPLKVVGVRFKNGFNAYPRYYDFYGVEDDDTETVLWHIDRSYGTFAENMRCENPRYFKRYRFV